jgi:hypothetical protein
MVEQRRMSVYRKVHGMGGSRAKVKSKVTGSGPRVPRELRTERGKGAGLG